MIIASNDTVETKKNKALLAVKRSDQPLTIRTVADSLEGQIIVNAQNSVAYKYNIFTLGIGALIDKNNPKRYEYPWTIKIDPTDTITRVYDNFNTPYKGSIYLDINFPYVNNFLLNPANEESKYSTGFLGSSIGLDYYYSSYKYLNFSLSATMDFLLPFPVPIDYDGGEHEFFNSIHFSVSDNQRINRFSIGYGLCYVKNSWLYRDYGNYDPNYQIQEIDRSHIAIGFVFPAYFQVGKTFNIGLI